MARPHLQPALDALYGMDMARPDWVPVLECLSSAFRSHVVAMQSHDALHRQGRVLTAIGIDGALLGTYRELAGEHPWFLKGSDTLLATGMADDRGLLAERDLRATRFHAEFMQHARIGHGLALCMHHAESGAAAVLTINRDWSGGYYDAEELDAARGLLPHLRCVYALQRRLGWLDRLTEGFRAALDELPEGVLLLGRGGQPLFANVAARQMAASRLYATRQDGRLRLPWPVDDRLLQQALSRLRVPGCVPVLLRLHDGAGALKGMLKLCPAAALAGAQWSEPEVDGVGFLRTVLAPLIDGRVLRRQWGFTPAEAELACRLLDGQSLAEAASDLGVSRNTVRAQLRELFDKTQTHRQAELVRMLLRLSHAVAAQPPVDPTRPRAAGAIPP